MVTGGSKGIGAATCRALAANQVRVAVVAREPGGIGALVEELRHSGATAVGVSADCSDAAAVERMRAAVMEALGPVDIVAAFAGGFERRTPLLEIDEAEFRAVIDGNLMSTFLTLRAFLPGMVERGRGVVVTMSSNSGRRLESPLTAHYAAAKAAVVTLTRHAALELGPSGVRLNCIAPATTRTERIERTMSVERLQWMSDLSPLGRLGSADDSAFATLFLASQASGWLTGVTLDVAGGRVML